MTTRRFVLPALLILALSGPGGSLLASDKEGWMPLFNGKDLSGWSEPLKNGSDWEVKGSVLTGRGCGSGKPAALATERQDFTNYRLRIKYGCRKPGGGFIQLRRSSPAEGVSSSYMVSAAVTPSWLAQQCPAGNVGKWKDYQIGAAWPPARDSQPVTAPANRWHTLEIEVTGNRVTTFVNGKKTDEFTDRKSSFQTGGIALFVCGDSAVQFQEVAIQELPE
jgi:Domain of Unknown Function (DUF1080)